jgi:hypothetical protein
VNPTPTPTPTGSVSISGSLNTGIVTTFSVKSARGGIKALSTATTPLQNYNVVAVAKSTGQVYFPEGKTDSSGDFTISSLPSGESFYLEVLDSGNKLVAPIAVGTVGTNVVMAITPEATSTIELGSIAYDSSKGVAAPTLEPTAFIDVTASAEVKSGQTIVPVGAGNLGKGSVANFSGSYNVNNVDGDQDGLPNFFDADNNGDGVVDEMDGLYTREALTVGTIVPDFFVYAFTNLKVDFDNRNTFKTNYSEFDIAVGVTLNTKGGSTKTISSVRVSEGPTWMTKATVLGGGLWSATSYDVPSKGNYFEVHLQGLKPLTDVNAGDALKFVITFSDGTSEDAIKMLNFVFTDIPQATQYKIGSNPWQNITATAGPISSASTSEISLRWTRPKDESGSEISGGRYTWEYNAIGGGAHEVEIVSKDTSTATSVEGSYLMGSLSDADFSGTEFMIGICIRSIAGDNAAENVRFTKGW